MNNTGHRPPPMGGIGRGRAKPQDSGSNGAMPGEDSSFNFGGGHNVPRTHYGNDRGNDYSQTNGCVSNGDRFTHDGNGFPQNRLVSSAGSSANSAQPAIPWDQFAQQQSGRNSGRGSFGGKDRGGGGFGGQDRGGGGFGGQDRGDGGFRGSRGGGGFGRGGGGNNCFKCGEPGHRAGDCQQAPYGRDSGFSGRGGRGFPRDSGGAGFGSHGGGNAGDSRTCHKCGRGGHISRDCHQSSASGGFGTGGGFGGGSGGMRCRTCGEEGHIARYCTNVQRNNKCFNCGEEGHIERTCTQPRKIDRSRTAPATYEPDRIEDEPERLLESHVHTGINFDRYDAFNVEVTSGDDSFDAARFFIDSFDAAGLPAQVLKNLQQMQYRKPTPIQRRALPIIAAGYDVMGCAQTGSGKTAAYLLPIIADIINRGYEGAQSGATQEPLVLILAPTRELCKQICQEGEKFAAFTTIKCCRVYGGVKVDAQLRWLQEGCTVLSATPGRLLDWVHKGHVSLAKVRHLVLDEADRMLDQGFSDVITKLCTAEGLPANEQRQTLLFSATFPTEVQQMAKQFLRPTYVMIVVGVIGGANADITQKFLKVDSQDKIKQVTDMVKAELDVTDKRPEDDKKRKILVFVERKRTADFLAGRFSQLKISTTSIHSDRTQQQREEALADFKSGRCSVLIATSVAARGLDIQGVDHVMNYDLPQEIDDYVHRIGRTGRVGCPGLATSFYDSNLDEPLSAPLRSVLAWAHQEIPEFLIDTLSTRFGENNGDTWDKGAAGMSTVQATPAAVKEDWD